MKTTTFKIFGGTFIFVAAIFTFTSCSVTEGIETVNETVEEASEELLSEDALTPLQRLYKCSLIRGKLVVEPIIDGTIANNHVHVITHGWAPAYRPAVEAYARMNKGATLLAWQPEAIAGGEQFFVGSFFPLAESILNADPGSAVLVFSWIDISATDVSFLSFLEGNDYDQFCRVEQRTPRVGKMLTDAVDAALKPGVPHELHLLGHSFGTKVVSIAGVALKQKGYLNRIHITLFDSPEEIPYGGECGDNRLCGILPSFEPDRDKYFVDNYISYWDKCFSDCHDTGNELHFLVDATIIPYGRFVDSCELETYGDCASCKHSAGVFWYTAATNDAAHESGLWWSPLMGNLKKTEGLHRYYYKPYSEHIKISPSPDCRRNEISTCPPLPLEEEEN